MRYFVCLGVCFVALPMFAYNEVVPSISYNPSRLGSYTHLKAVEKATLSGGLKAGTGVPVSILNNVTITDRVLSHQCASPCANVDTILSQISTIGNTNERTTTYATSEQGGLLQGKSGSLYGSSYNGRVDSDNSGLTVTMKGGTLNVPGIGYVRRIKDLNGITNSALSFDVTTLEMEDTKEVIVEGNSYKIGEINIRKPDSNSLRNGVSSYKFIERVDNEGTRYKVLTAK